LKFFSLIFSDIRAARLAGCWHSAMLTCCTEHDARVCVERRASFYLW